MTVNWGKEDRALEKPGKKKRFGCDTVKQVGKLCWTFIITPGKSSNDKYIPDNVGKVQIST